MKQQYSAYQINAFMSISPTEQCACPAQLCGSIVDLRELHDYEFNCISDGAIGHKVHEAISKAAEQAHAILENCLTSVLEIEGIDPHMAPVSKV